MVYAPSDSVTAVRTAPVWMDVTVTVTPGSTAEVESVAFPVMRDSVNCAAAGSAAARSARPMMAAVARVRNAGIQNPPNTFCGDNGSETY
jgi:tRNA A37 threonylcarbamoyltransferase TsaD